jgi:hypothetical protein
MRLKLAGADRSKGSRCVVPLRARDVRPLLLRRRASRPQLKRDPLGTHELMENHELNPDDLEPEFRRIGTNAYDALRELVNRNRAGREDAVAPGESIDVQINVPLTLRILRSLPNGAGAAAFADAMVSQRRPYRDDGPDKTGAGA